MIKIEKILKKDFNEFLNRKEVWNHSFLSISKSRLFAHLKNPNLDEEDMILLLAYLNEEIVGYMGIYIDIVNINGNVSKIGWLSTWWLHPNTFGLGLGKEMLKYMYDSNNGKIGISSFTKSAKRVYNKSGYFSDLKVNKGLRVLLKRNYEIILPNRVNLLNKDTFIVKSADFFLNIFNDIKLNLYKPKLIKKLSGIKVEYLNFIDSETRAVINKNNQNDLSFKTDEYFEWLKAYNWVQENQLLSLSENEKYEFSMYSNRFIISLIKIIENEICIGFVVLQQKSAIVKILFTYFDSIMHTSIIADVIILHSINANAYEIQCFETPIVEYMKKLKCFIKRDEMEVHSMISNVFSETDFKKMRVSFGDGDCAFT